MVHTTQLLHRETLNLNFAGHQCQGGRSEEVLSSCWCPVVVVVMVMVVVVVVVMSLKVVEELLSRSSLVPPLLLVAD